MMADTDERTLAERVEVIKRFGPRLAEAFTEHRVMVREAVVFVRLKTLDVEVHPIRPNRFRVMRCKDGKRIDEQPAYMDEASLHRQIAAWLKEGM